jgi:ubiquinone/menaquinone biosynthesis C-methylase UbiE
MECNLGLAFVKKAGETMSVDEYSLKEIEDLSYYDFMGYLDVPFFNIGGVASIERLAELCRIVEDMNVLVVGCGTGGNACYLAQTYGCQVTGIDIAENMIQKATLRAEELNLTDRVTFQLGDAYNLQFPSGSFDGVLTVFVSQFLNKGRAFPEFVRVMKNGGFLGINEMYKSDVIPPEATDSVREGERLFQDLTELPFTLISPSEWQRLFESASLTNIIIEEYHGVSQQRNSLKIIKDFGGWGKLIKTLGKIVVLSAKSKKLRSRFGKISKGKRLLLQDKIASNYIGYILVAGRKT